MSAQIIKKGTGGGQGFTAPTTAGQDDSIVAPAVAIVLAPSDPSVQILTPSAGINLDLPTSADAPNKKFLISNIGSFNVTVRQSVADGGATLQVLFPGFAAQFVSTGVTTVSNGWANYGQLEIGSAAADTGAKVLTVADERTQLIDPVAGNVNVDLPVAATVPGETWSVFNTGDGVQTVTVRSEGPVNLAVLRPGESYSAIALRTSGVLWDDVHPLTHIGFGPLAIAGGATETQVESSIAFSLIANTGGNGTGDAILRLPPEGPNEGRLSAFLFSSFGGAAGTEGLSIVDDAGAPVGAGIDLPDVAVTVTRSCIFLTCDGVAWRSMGAFDAIVGSF